MTKFIINVKIKKIISYRIAITYVANEIRELVDNSRDTVNIQEDAFRNQEISNSLQEDANRFEKL